MSAKGQADPLHTDKGDNVTPLCTQDIQSVQSGKVADQCHVAGKQQGLDGNQACLQSLCSLPTPYTSFSLFCVFCASCPDPNP